MPTTTTILGRLKLAHPDLGYDGGAGLEAAIKAIYTTISDAIASRFFTVDALANGASHDFEHNFKCAFTELGIRLYTRNTGTGELTRVYPTTGYSIVAKVGSETTHITVTNNTGSAKDIAVVLLQWPKTEVLDDLSDVDLTVAPEDGQALVWDAIAAAFKPGASGDASFKVQGVTDPNATIKGGYLMLPDGRELATYDGAGSASTDFGKDLTVSLDTILGGNPVNATTYHLAIDLLSLGAAVTQTDTGRVVYPITISNFVLLTTTPEASNRGRYVFRGFIRSADSGTVWSGTGSKFGTLAFLQQPANVPAQSPLVYSLAQQTVGSVGATGQIRQGHLLAASSFPTAAQDTAKLSIYGMDNTPNDEYGGRNLTAANSPAGAVGLFNVSNEALALVGASSQRLYSADSFFQPFGAGSFAVGGWFKPSVVTGTQGYFARQGGSGSRQWLVRVDASVLQVFACSDGINDAMVLSYDVTGRGGTMFHVALVWTGTELRLFVDGKNVGSAPWTTFANTSPNFEVGAYNAGSFLTGTVDEVFYVKGVVLTDADIAKLTSTKLPHNKAMAASRQLWMGRHYAGGSAPVSDFSGFVLDMSNTNAAFVDLSGCDPTDKVDLMLFDSGAAGALSVPVQTPEFYLTANIPGAGLDTNLAETPRSLQGWQLDADSHWQPLDLVGLVYIDQADGMKLKGDISSLSPSPTTPVRIVVSTTAVAQAVARQTATNLAGLVDGTRNGGGVFLKRPDGTVRELALDNSDNIVVLDT